MSVVLVFENVKKHVFKALVIFERENIAAQPKIC